MHRCYSFAYRCYSFAYRYYSIGLSLSYSGAILSVNLLKNGIGVEQARALVIILTEHPTLKSLCGNNGDETELDMSGKMKGVEDAIMLAAEIVDNGALTSLNLSSNNLMAEGGKIVAEAIKVTNLYDCGRFGTVFMPIGPLVELLLFAAIHRIMGQYPP
jgi:hypothetical protein